MSGTLHDRASAGDPGHGLPRWLWALVLLVAIGPAWLVSRDIWDGSVGRYGVDKGDWRGIHEWLVASNWFLSYLELRGIAWLQEMTGVPSWVWFKLTLTGAIAGIAWEMRLLSARLFGLSPRDSDAAGLLALAFPCWYLLYGTTFSYVIFIWWLFLGWRLLHDGQSAPARALGWLLLLCSFQVNSGFVMVFALEAARWLLIGRPVGAARRRSLGVCASAVIIYLALRFGFPPRAQYASYNDLVVPTGGAGLLRLLRSTAMYATWLPLMALPAMAGWLLRRPGMPASQGTARHSVQWRGVLALAVLCVGAVFPYIAVGKGGPLFAVQLPNGWFGSTRHMGQQVQDLVYMTLDGWSTRHLFMLAAPAGIVMAVLASRFGGSASGPGAWRWKATFAVTLAACMGLNLAGHAAKLARFSQEESIVRGLQAVPQPPGGLVNIQISPPVRWSVAPYESNYWFWLAYGADRWASVALQGLVPEARDALLAEREQAIASQDPAQRSFLLMAGLEVPAACLTELSVSLPPDAGALAWIGARLGFDRISPARVESVRTECPPVASNRRQ